MCLKRKFFEIYKIVKKIPKGKVTTYGQIAEKLKNITPRMVGWALHNNPDPKNIPCHRVVNREGKLAKNFAFGGAKRQKELLLKEGVRFCDSWHVDLDKSLWKN